MNQELISFGLDIVIAVLLCVTIIYAFLLNKRLQALRADREEMEGLLRKFYDATNKADASIKSLKSSSMELGQNLQDKIDKARAIRDEMSFMLERGDMLAGQLEGAISSARPEKAGPDLASLLQKGTVPADKPRREKNKDKDIQNLESIFQAETDTASSAEKELLKALKALR